MSGAGWTPGPWRWVDGLTDAAWSFDGGSDGYPSLRTVEKFGKTETVVRDGKHYSSHALPLFILDAQDPVEEANARLIAAAPDLYAALAELVECVMGGDLDNGGQGVDSDRHDAALSAARAALSRASGSEADHGSA